MPTELPKCVLCGATPSSDTSIKGHVICPTSRGLCGIGGVLLSEAEWRILHGHRLAPEQVEAMLEAADICDEVNEHALAETVRAAISRR